MRQVFINDDYEVMWIDEGVPVALDCYQNPARRCTRYCAAFQEELETALAPAHLGCGRLRVDAWIGVLVDPPKMKEDI